MIPARIALALLMTTGSAWGQTLSTSGVCPGPVSIQAGALTPGGDYIVLKGEGVGEAALRGPCAGSASGLSSYRRFGPFRADGSGDGMLSPELSRADSDWIQVVDLATCGTSPAVPLCWDGLGLAGSFAVSDGPPWASDPPTYSCVEACAEVFGGTSDDWQCSTRADAANGMAYVDGWGDASSCDEPVADDYKLGATYDCGEVGCSYSAYISDHACASRNYCWSDDSSLACVADAYESDNTLDTASTFDTSWWTTCRLLGMMSCEISHEDVRSCTDDDDYHQFSTVRSYGYETIITFDPSDGDLTAELLSSDGMSRGMAEVLEPGRLRLWFGLHDDYYCDAYWDVYDCPSTLTVRVSQLSDAGPTKGVAYDISVTELDYF